MCYRQTSAVIKGKLNAKEEHLNKDCTSSALYPTSVLYMKKINIDI